MTTDRKPSPGGNLYVGPSLSASLIGLLSGLSRPADPATVAQQPTEVIEA